MEHLHSLDQHLTQTVTMSLGQIQKRSDIRSCLGPFNFYQNYRTVYPAIVVEALYDLYTEYNHAFAPLVAANAEWSSDYAQCMNADAPPNNFMVQIDMVSLPPSFLATVDTMSSATVREILRKRIFEIENSIAMYQLLEKGFANGKPSFFSTKYRQTLDVLRNKHQRPIALLAVTQQKYDAMCAIEFGKEEGVPSPDEVYALSGFDHFFSPRDLVEHIRANNGTCHYLLYARTSDPVSKLRKPQTSVDHPLLGDPAIRKIIKAHTVTFNIDDPTMDPRRKINDTKAYMPTMDMAYAFDDVTDLLHPTFVQHLTSKKPTHTYPGTQRLSHDFADFLLSHGVTASDVASAHVHLRFKPQKGCYGCYGHVTGSLLDGDVRRAVRTNMRQRSGGYIVQPEMPNLHVLNSDDRHLFTCIDRVFLSCVDNTYQFLGGFRSMMPVHSVESKSGRNHGNALTVCGEIVS